MEENMMQTGPKPMKDPAINETPKVTGQSLNSRRRSLQMNTSHIIDVLKAAFPYIGSRTRQPVDTAIKAAELMNSFQSNQDTLTLRTQSLDLKPADPEGMLCSLKDVCTNRERDMIDTLLNCFRAKKLYQAYNLFTMNKEASKAAGFTGASPFGSNNVNIMEALKNMFTPEQAKNIENISNVLNTMNMMNRSNSSTSSADSNTQSYTQNFNQDYNQSFNQNYNQEYTSNYNQSFNQSKSEPSSNNSYNPFADYLQKHSESSNYKSESTQPATDMNEYINRYAPQFDQATEQPSYSYDQPSYSQPQPYIKPQNPHTNLSYEPMQQTSEIPHSPISIHPQEPVYEDKMLQAASFSSNTTQAPPNPVHHMHEQQTPEWSNVSPVNTNQTASRPAQSNRNPNQQMNRSSNHMNSTNNMNNITNLIQTISSIAPRK